MRQHRKGELALKILYFLSVGTMIPASLIVPNAPKVFQPLIRELAKKLESRPDIVRSSLTSLKRKRLIKVIQKKGETVFILSEEGKRRIVRGEIDKLTIPEPKRWDKRWRVVIFDIPEREKNTREALRVKLEELGFYQLQKSCFVYPFECQDQIDFISEFFGISQYINYLVVESLEGERALKDRFKL